MDSCGHYYGGGQMAKKRKVGNLLALAVLSYLSRAPMRPYELSRMLRDNNDVRSIKFSQGSLPCRTPSPPLSSGSSAA
jgi:hypothetical protein